MALKYTRVKDRETGHQYDVLSHKVNPDLHELVNRYPETSTPRAPKPNVKRRAATTSGRRAKRSTKTGTAPAADSNTTEPGAESA